MTSWSKRRPEPLRALAASAAAIAFLHSGAVLAQEAQPGFPATEELRYTISWPSGLSVGTADFKARWTDPGWRFELTLRASLPKLEIDDRFISSADAQMCSQEFEKHMRHGDKRASELLRFRADAVERTNLERADQESPGLRPIRGCARDALSFLYFVRTELASGRIPPPATVHFGAGYVLSLELAETRWLTWDGERQLADRIRVAVRGPQAEHRFSAYFGRDEWRVPLLFRMTFGEDEFLMRLAE